MLRPPVIPADHRHLIALHVGCLAPEQHQPLPGHMTGLGALLVADQRRLRDGDSVGHALHGKPLALQVGQESEPINAQIINPTHRARSVAVSRLHVNARMMQGLPCVSDSNQELP